MAVEFRQYLDYFAKYQWYVRPACAVDAKPGLFDSELPVKDSAIDIEELRQVIKKLKNNKASGLDEIPAEIWKAIAMDDEALQYLVQLHNQCW